jgi:5-methylcytosine-specific restriction protein B
VAPSKLEGPGLGPSLGELAEELLVEERFLEKIVELLRDRGQVIFYGPPGTGKTFVARKLMEHLASERSRREVVQFHPSYSYEDFVQGYRPVTREDGSLTYELKPGPLMRLAKQAAESPGEHLLLIDEINRGNLPKILGELLYLLEYRNDEVVLMYGEDEDRFSLPKDLLIIGTMNTADRSIALIDAALRRRFHFVPFFPSEPPLDGLLRRWLKKHRPEMIKVADVVDKLNAGLRPVPARASLLRSSLSTSGRGWTAGTSPLGSRRRTLSRGWLSGPRTPLWCWTTSHRAGLPTMCRGGTRRRTGFCGRPEIARVEAG